MPDELVLGAQQFNMLALEELLDPVRERRIGTAIQRDVRIEPVPLHRVVGLPPDRTEVRTVDVDVRNLIASVAESATTPNLEHVMAQGGSCTDERVVFTGSVRPTDRQVYRRRRTLPSEDLPRLPEERVHCGI